jgi:hypothetical protein
MDFVISKSFTDERCVIIIPEQTFYMECIHEISYGSFSVESISCWLNIHMLQFEYTVFCFNSREGNTFKITST